MEVLEELGKDSFLLYSIYSLLQLGFQAQLAEHLAKSWTVDVLVWCAVWQRWQQVIFCKSKSSHKSFPCKSKSSHKSFPCKSKSSHKSFGQTSSQVTSHLVQTQVTSLFVQVQVKSHIILSSCNTQSGSGIKLIDSELQSKIYEMVNSI